MATDNFSTPEWRNVSQEEKDICEAHLTELPVRMSRLAKELGVKVISSTLPSGISGELRPCSKDDIHGSASGRASGFMIRVNRHETRNRQRFTVAHELGHFLLHKSLVEDGIVDNVLYRSTLSNEIETQANRVAADLLMPKRTIESWIKERLDRKPTEDDLELISEEWKVSKLAAKIRLGL